ncbi:MAG: DUF72 domain-containing protein, partial [Chloroflexi bacterium]|nr:DUF72 domain-containing protein [Chloroflexota bacterium]
LIGTCSWTDPTLLATDFYPAEANTAEKRLQYYARHFPLVEIDSTYYTIHPEQMAKLWVERTPTGFTFNIKAFSLFTQHPTKLKSLPKELRSSIPPTKNNLYYHDLSIETRGLLWEKFRNALLPLDSAGKLGVVIFQLPPWLIPGNAIKEHLLECKSNVPHYKVAIEFRNNSWLNEKNKQPTLEFLRRNDFIYVCVDEPQGFSSSVPSIDEATSNISVIRFHGRNRETWNKQGITVAERFKYLYSDDELKEWLTKLSRIAAGVKQLHVLFNNCYADFGIKNAQDMDRLIRAQPRLFPDYYLQ